MLACLGLLACLGPSWAGAAPAPGAATGPGLRVVAYHGYQVLVPRTWPVYDLAKDPQTCVRFNRHAVYLGQPGADERCPAQAIGRTEAVLLQPAPASAAQASALPAVVGAGGGSSGWKVDRSRGVLIAATWGRHPGLVTRALRLHSLHPLLKPDGVLPGGAAVARPSPLTVTAARQSTAARPGAVYTGRGFDACATPSSSQMSAWRRASPYRAVGIYIGGTNLSSCARGLSASWVSRESAAGWHLMPIYVGRQAPSNNCCSPIHPRSAVPEGRYAARDAVNRARAFGIGPGNPLYVDMEGYDRGPTNSQAVLTFLRAWTTQLHDEGYLSGVYSSADSGIVDLVSRVGSAYREPDELWIARWNDVQNTSDPNVPPAYWPTHERLHQNAGEVSPRYGGVQLSIDGDYVDAATAAAGTAPGALASPREIAPPTISGSPTQGHALTLWHGSWSGVPRFHADQWEDCDQSGSNCTPIAGATKQRYVLRGTDVGHRIRVAETATNRHGTSAPVTSAATPQVLNHTPLYWLFTAYGNVYPSAGTAWYGSPRSHGFRGASATGMSATRDHRGYWVVSSSGKVFPFGDAARLSVLHHSNRIRGIVAAAGRGYWLYTATGSVYPSRGAAWYGSPFRRGFRGSSITGMAATNDGKGYWVVDSAGTVFAFGDARKLAPAHRSRSIRGIVTAPRGGFWLYSSHGNVYPARGTGWFGSPHRAGYHTSSLAGMTPTPDGRGYWVVDAGGRVLPFGDAASLPAVRHAHPITGIAR
ncbi:MAG: DUF1906 domain-containing protein [Solirubrobacteraceae bacterium]